MKNRYTNLILAFFSIAIALYPIAYFITDGKFGLLNTKTEALLADIVWNTGFYIHIVFGGLALLIGWMQFNNKIRRLYLKVHRNIGKAYMIFVLFSSLAGIFIAFNASTGWVASVGFILLGLVWLSTTLAGYISIRNRQIFTHQKWMIYSYAACFAAVTLRIWLPTLMAIFNDFSIAYPLVAYLSWIPNLIVAYFIVRTIPRTNTLSSLSN